MDNFKCVKFHQFGSSILELVVLTRIIDRWTDKQIDSYIPLKTLFARVQTHDKTKWFGGNKKVSLV